MQVGFVGLGQMGLPMARHLAGACDLRAYDRLGRQHDGVVVVEEAAALGGVELLITCLPNGDVVEDVLFGSQGIAAALPEGAVVLDTSTADHATTLRIGERLTAQGLRFLDAPISGMQKRAEDGTLTMMCGGDPAVLDMLRPLLSHVATTILHMGPVGAGQLTKLINQLLFDINCAALAEILPMATALGLDPERMGEVVNSGTGRSYASEFFIPNILDGVFDQGYPLEAAYKDLISGAQLSARHRMPAPVLAAATATYQQALLAGHGEKDKGAMILPVEAALGVRFRKTGD